MTHFSHSYFLVHICVSLSHTCVCQNHEVSFSSVNVLEYPTVREGVKAYSDWPTIPQLYVNGEFVGGCDIVLGMEEDGELGELLDTVEGAKDSKE